MSSAIFAGGSKPRCFKPKSTSVISGEVRTTTPAQGDGSANGFLPSNNNRSWINWYGQRWSLFSFVHRVEYLNSPASTWQQLQKLTIVAIDKQKKRIPLSQAHQMTQNHFPSSQKPQEKVISSRQKKFPDVACCCFLSCYSCHLQVLAQASAAPASQAASQKPGSRSFP